MSFAHPSATKGVLDEVWDERDRQDIKFGPTRTHPYIAPGVGAIDAGAFYDIPNVEAAKATCDRRFAHGLGTWTDILLEEVCEAVDALANTTPADARAELVQVAAVAVAMIEAIDRDGAR